MKQFTISVTELCKYVDNNGLCAHCYCWMWSDCSITEVKRCKLSALTSKFYAFSTFKCLLFISHFLLKTSNGACSVQYGIRFVLLCWSNNQRVLQVGQEVKKSSDYIAVPRARKAKLQRLQGVEISLKWPVLPLWSWWSGVRGRSSLGARHRKRLWAVRMVINTWTVEPHR